MTMLNAFTDIAIRNLKAIADEESLLETAVDLLAGRSGTVFAIGIGKSSFIARKFVASLQSIGVRASFLHPAEALHGDCGPLSKGDVCLIVSKSGNSQEINALLPIIHARSVNIIALTNVKASLLAKSADVVLDLHVTKEGDQDNLLPLISCQISLFMCDYIVAQLAARMSFGAENFRRNHPGGQIGLNLNRSLRELREWQSRKPFIEPGALLVEALIKISECRVGLCCVVGGDAKFQGIVTDGDIRRALMAGFDIRTTPASVVMNSDPLVVRADTPLSEVFNMMECGESKVAALPVLDEFLICCGIVLVHDLMAT